MRYQTEQIMTKSSQSGFTLVELIMTLTIASIILTQAIPSFSTMISNNRLITQTNDLVADINLARSEAITRGVRVILCRSADSRTVSPTCGGTNNTWSTGWLVYAENDGTAGFLSTADTLIRIGQPTDDSIAIMANANGNTDLQFNSDGTTNETGTAIFAICDARGESEGRQINVNNVGRPRLTSTSIADCTP